MTTSYYFAYCVEVVPVLCRLLRLQCRIKVGAIDAAALGPLLKIGPPS